MHAVGTAQTTQRASPNAWLLGRDPPDHVAFLPTVVSTDVVGDWIEGGGVVRAVAVQSTGSGSQYQK